MQSIQLLPSQEIRLESIGIRSWLRPEGAPRSPLAVVICPGNPGEEFGSSHAGAPLITALAEALAKVHVPVITFDYTGVGMSGPNSNNESPNTWKVPTDAEALKSVQDALTWAQENVSDRIVIYGYSYGSSQALSFATSNKCYGYVSISVSTRIWILFPPDQHESVKSGMNEHKLVTCKALYVIGEKDKLSPSKEVQELIAARRDDGVGAELKVIPQGVHHLEGKEEEVGQMCALWVGGLLNELPSEDERPVKDADIEWEDVKVRCMESATDSVFDWFYVSTPAGSTVAAFRAALANKGVQQSDVELFELGATSMRALENHELCPLEVMIKDLNQKITHNMILTKRQGKQAQAAIKASVESPEFQATLDEKENEAKGNDTRYRIHLGKVLLNEVYPDVLGLFELPASSKGVACLTQSIAANADTPMIEIWLHLETLMRNKAAMAQASTALEASKKATKVLA